MHVYVEEGLDAGFFVKAAELSAAIVAESGEFPQPRVVYEGTFIDNRTLYPQNSSLPPPGISAENVDRPALDVWDGQLDLNVVLYNGTGDGFNGLSDCRNWIALFPKGFVLAELPTFIQEFGHALGLLHEKNSKIMDGGLILTDYATLTSLDPSGVDRFLAGEVPALGDPWMPWAVPRGLFYAEDAESRSTFRQVVFRDGFHGRAVVVLVGGYRADLSSGNRSAYFVRWETNFSAWSSAWTAEELAYLRSWRSSLLSNPPPPSVGSRITTGDCDPSLSVLESLGLDPREWAISFLLGAATFTGLLLLPDVPRKFGPRKIAAFLQRVASVPRVSWTLPLYLSGTFILGVYYGLLSGFMLVPVSSWLAAPVVLALRAVAGRLR